MSGIFGAIYSAWNQIIYAISNIRIPFDIIDILIMAYIVYKAVEFLRETRAGQLVKGIIILLVVYFIANWWELATLKWALSKVMDAAIIAIAVIFQPELRRILERVGRTNFTKDQIFGNDATRFDKCIDNISRAAGTMQEQKIGALIVFERKTQLGEIINTGTIIDATSSVSMVNNVFFPKSPLHDGALIVRDGRLYAAGCILPLAQLQENKENLGTRHRAAIGMTENSDAVVLVVSEETGIISIVQNGRIKRGYNAASAREELRNILLDDNKTESRSSVILGKVRKLLKLKGKAEKEDEKESN